MAKRTAGLSETITSENAVEVWRTVWRSATKFKSEKKLKEAERRHIFSVRSVDQITGFEEISCLLKNNKKIWDCALRY